MSNTLKPLFVYWMVLLMIMVQAKNILASEEQTAVTLYYTGDKNQSIMIQPMHNKELDIIQFNISCPDCKLDDNFCNIIVSRKRISCINGVPMDDGNKQLKFSFNSKFLLIPDNDSALVLYPGCAYQFKSDVTEPCNITGQIEVPACVDGKCNCNQFNFTFLNIDTQLYGNNLTIIVYASFEEDLDVYRVAYEISCLGIAKNHTDVGNNYHEIVITEILNASYFPLEYGRFCSVQLTYYNVRNCSDAAVFQLFDLPELKVEPIDQHHMEGFIIAILVGAIIAVVVILFFLFKTKRPSAKSLEARVTQQTFFNVLYQTNILNEIDNWIDPHEYNHDQIRIIMSIGSGEFGEVFLAKSDRLYQAYGRNYKYIAVKKLRGNARQQETTDFLQEMAIMSNITNFEHVVRMLGYCKTIAPYMIITEYVCSGDLKKYLIELRELWIIKSQSKLFTGEGEYIDTSMSDSRESPEPPDSPNSTKYSDSQSGITKLTDLSQQSPLLENEEKFNYQLEAVLDGDELQNFALQIAKGMAHLESIPMIHRDLAARNVLVTECKVLKISDFGLSCLGEINDASMERMRIPVRWTALDVFDTRMYDLKSDIWSFAVVLWEIGMLGACPYQDLDNTELIAYLRHDHNRLERPPICSESLYELMLRCWSRDSSLRPSFRYLVDLLDSKRRRIYEKFDIINPTYIFPPTEEKDKE